MQFFTATWIEIEIERHTEKHVFQHCNFTLPTTKYETKPSQNRQKKKRKDKIGK